MSESSERGKAFENKVRKLTHEILKLDVKRDKQSGAGIRKADILGRYYGEIPLFIECKDQATIKPKEWWRVAEAKASYGESPVVVFPDNEETLCVMRYSDLLQFIREMWDWRKALVPESATLANQVKKTVTAIRSNGACPNGHLTDTYGYCLDRKCKYSRGYKAKTKSK